MKTSVKLAVLLVALHGLDGYAALTPSPQSILTDEGWTVYYGDTDSTSDGYCPKDRAQVVANAIDAPYSTFPGEPDGFLEGFRVYDLLEPQLESKQVWIRDLEGTNTWGEATYNEMRIDANFAATNPEKKVRATTGHELFHQIQYNYLSVKEVIALSDFSVEGLAKTVEDKVFVDLDNYGSSAYRDRVSELLYKPTYPLFLRTYSAAPFWSYCMEQFGALRDEPGVGMDFVRRFLEHAADHAADRDIRELIQMTMDDFPRYTTSDETGSVDLDDLLLDFYIALAFENGIGFFPSEYARYRIVDHGNYKPVTWNLNSAPPIPVISEKVQFYGSRYISFNNIDPAADFISFSGYCDSPSAVGFTLLAIADGHVEKLFRSGTNVEPGNQDTIVFPQDASNAFDRIDVIATGWGLGHTDFEYLDSSGFYDLNAYCVNEFSFDFNTLSADSLEIIDPSGLRPAYVGDENDPKLMRIRVKIESSDGPIPELEAEDFSVWIAPDVFGDPSTYSGFKASVVGSIYLGSDGDYWLAVMPPVQPFPVIGGEYTVAVSYADKISDIAVGAVRYQNKTYDQMLTLDASGSMASDGKMEAMIQAARFYAGTAQSDDQIGYLRFKGDNVEPNDDAFIPPNGTLEPASPAKRISMSLSMAGLTPSGYTSIGDGIMRAVTEFDANGGNGEDWIVLLSDGSENEDFYWDDIAHEVTNRGIKVEAIALGPQTDQPLLQEIALSTGGRYWPIDVSGGAASAFAMSSESLVTPASLSITGPLQLRLSDAFLGVMEDVRGMERLWEEDGQVSSGNSNQLAIAINETVEPALFSLSWDTPASDLRLTLRRPDGSTVSATDAGVDVRTNDAQFIVFIEDATNGMWTVDVEALAGSANYNLVLSGQLPNGPTLDLFFDQVHGDTSLLGERGIFLRGLPMPIKCTLFDTSGPVLGATVEAVVHHPQGFDETILLYDDGVHGDMYPDDGVYGNTYTRTTGFSWGGFPDNPAIPRPWGSYNVVVTATGTNNHSNNFTRISKGGFHIYDPDPLNPDSLPVDFDEDGMPDRYELLHSCLNPAVDDALEDADGDSINNIDEYLMGINPCSADTDNGGESDASELALGANPRDNRDDAVARPHDVEVITHNTDGLTYDLQPNQNLIRYNLHSTYDEMLLYRSTAPTGFTHIATINVATNQGLYADTNLVNGTTYYYYLEAVSSTSATSAPSYMIVGTPKADPIPPGGYVIIADGASQVDDLSVELTLGASTDVVEMVISDDTDFGDDAWQAFTNRIAHTLVPDTNGIARVWVKFKDTSENVSLPEADAVEVLSSNSLGSVSALAYLDPVPSFGGNHGGVYAVLSTNSYDSISSSDGTVTINHVQPGTYDLHLSRAGYGSVTISNIVVSASGPSADGGTNTLYALDSDGDDALDLEELYLGLDPENPDMDGDSISDGAELYKTRTDPTNPASVLAITDFGLLPSNQLWITWSSVSGVVYEVLALDALTSPVPETITNVPANAAGPETEVIVPEIISSNRFFRISVP